MTSLCGVAVYNISSIDLRTTSLYGIDVYNVSSIGPRTMEKTLYAAMPQWEVVCGLIEETFSGAIP